MYKEIAWLLGDQAIKNGRRSWSASFIDGKSCNDQQTKNVGCIHIKRRIQDAHRVCIPICYDWSVSGSKNAPTEMFGSSKFAEDEALLWIACLGSKANLHNFRIKMKRDGLKRTISTDEIALFYCALGMRNYLAVKVRFATHFPTYNSRRQNW